MNLYITVLLYKCMYFSGTSLIYKVYEIFVIIRNSRKNCQVGIGYKNKT